MTIIRTVKSAQLPDQLERILKVAQEIGANGLEVQQIVKVMKEISLQKRSKLIVEKGKQYGIKYLAYHFPYSESDILQNRLVFDLASKDNDFAIKSVLETAEEAAIVANKLKIESTVPIDIHLFGFVERKKISLQEKKRKLRNGEDALFFLRDTIDDLSNDHGLVMNGEPLLKLVREMNPPEHGSVDGLLDYHPNEISRTAQQGIGTVLDLAHMWQYMLYVQYGQGEFPAVDLDRYLYTTCFDWKYVVKTLSPSLFLIHLNDSGPSYRKDTEGIEVGKGTIPHEEVIQLLCENLDRSVIGTYEIKNAHIYPEMIKRSDEKYKKTLGNRFNQLLE